MKQPAIYHISVCETLCKTVSVYAESEDAALQLVRDRYRDRDIELFAEDLDGTDFDVLDREDDADPANADYNAVALSDSAPDYSAMSNDKLKREALAAAKARDWKRWRIIADEQNARDGVRTRTIGAEAVAEAKHLAPEQQTMPGVLDNTKVSKAWRDSMRPQYTRDLNGQAIYVSQATMF